MKIKKLFKQHYSQWLPLWQENCLHQIDDETTTETWRRLCSKNEPVWGLGVFDNDDNLQGFLHYILHHTTGFKEPACYMQDVFIAPNARLQGLAKRLIWELHDMGKTEKWARIYWFAQKNDIAAQNLYKNLGINMDFSLHILPTQE